MTISSLYCERGRVYSIMINREFNDTDRPHFKSAYDNIPAEAENLILNLQHTTHIDSSALGMMMQMHQEIGHKVARIDIVNTNRDTRKILEMAYFEKFFNIN